MSLATSQIDKIRGYGERLRRLIEIMDELGAWRDRHCGASPCAKKGDPSAQCARISKAFDSSIRSVARDRYAITALRWLDAESWLVDESGRTIDGADLSRDKTARAEIFEMQDYVCQDFMRGTVELLKCAANAKLGREILERWETEAGTAEARAAPW